MGRYSRRLKVGALALALSVPFVPMTARALNLPMVPNLPIPPLPIPDLCLALGGCPVQFTDYTLLVKLQEYRALVQNFANVRNMAGLQGAIQQLVAIVNAANAAPRTIAGDVAAQRTITTMQNTQNRLSGIDAQAVAADGAQQQEQVGNAYASTIAANTAQTNALLSEDQDQNAANLAEFSDNLELLGSGEQPVDGL